MTMTYGLNKLRIEQMPSKRSDAKKAGHQFYYTGKLCKWGHQSPRYTKNSLCVLCRKLSYERNREKEARNSKAYYDNNLEHIRETKKAYYLKNREALKKKQRDYRKKIKEEKALSNTKNFK
jgi:hypothetical protein